MNVNRRQDVLYEISNCSARIYLRTNFPSALVRATLENILQRGFREGEKIIWFYDLISG